MKHYLFLMAWIQGSESAFDVDTEVRKQEDLLIQLNKGNENIFAVHLTADAGISESLLMALGYKEAFFAGYTSQDTLSTWEETGPCFSGVILEHKLNINKIIVINMTTEIVMVEKST